MSAYADERLSQFHVMRVVAVRHEFPEIDASGPSDNESISLLARAARDVLYHAHCQTVYGLEILTNNKQSS